jgi:hypothetical protein
MTDVALFRGDEQVTDWVAFEAGTVLIPAEVYTRAEVHNFRLAMIKLQMRDRDGTVIARAAPSLHEQVVTTYYATWRTVW